MLSFTPDPTLVQLPDPGKPITVYCVYSKNRQTQIQTHFQSSVCYQLECGLSIVSRHHHSADHVHHHHWSECVHAPGVLHQSSGHIPLGQLRLRLLVCVRVRCCQLPVHSPGPPGAQNERTGSISGLF